MHISDGYRHVSVVNHQGCFVLFGLTGAKSPTISHQVYSGGTWSAPKPLPLPDLKPDASVKPWLRQHPAFGAHLDFVYSNRDQAQLLPIRAVSDGESIFLFRVSPTNTLWVDRFVYRRDKNEVESAWQVRYQGTGERYKPAGRNDPLTYYDSNNKPYLEPTTELKLSVSSGIFDVLRLPDASGGARWQIFTLTGANTVTSSSLGTSRGHPFDPSDRTVTAYGTGVQSRKVPGFVQYSFSTPAAPTGGISAQCYYLRKTVTDSKGNRQQLKASARVMLALATAPSLAVVDTSLQQDGILYAPKTFPGYQSINPGQAINFHTIGASPLSVAAYTLGNTGNRRAPFVLDSYDGFVHLLHIDSNSIPRAAYYDISSRQWCDENTKGSEGIKAFTPWEGATRRVPLIPSVSGGARTNSIVAYTSLTGELWVNPKQSGTNWADLLGRSAGLPGAPRFAQQAVIDEGANVWVVDERGDLIFGSYDQAGGIGHNWSNLTPGRGKNDPKAVKLFTPSWPLIVDIENQLWELKTGTTWQKVPLPAFGSRVITSIDAKAGRVYLTNGAGELWWRDTSGAWTHISNGNHYSYACARPAIAVGSPIIYAVWKGEVWEGQYDIFKSGYTTWKLVGRDVFRVHYGTDGSDLVALDHDYGMFLYEPAPKDTWAGVGLGSFAKSPISIAAIESGELTGSNPTQGVLKRSYFMLNSGNAASHGEFVLGDLFEEEVGINTMDEYIVGYVEGTIPVPSQNMTDKNNPNKYRGKGFNAIELSRSSQIDTSWATSESVGVDVLLEGKLSFAKAKLTFKDSFLNEAAVTVSQQTRQDAYITMDGKFQAGEFRPDNWGVAMTASCSTTVYALRLGGRGGPIVGYRQALHQTPQSLKAYPFKIDDKHVQNGDLSSYQKPSLDFTGSIERNTVEREAYYQQWNATFFKTHTKALPEIIAVDFMAPGNWAQGSFTDPSVSFKGTTMSGAGASFSLSGMVGVSVNGGLVGSYESLFGSHMDLVAKMSQASTDTVTLSIAFNGSYLDNPGKGKVYSYEWITFFLSQDLSHYDDLFANVVDLNWLQLPNDKYAAAFRKLVNRRRKVWRIAHAVIDVT